MFKGLFALLVFIVMSFAHAAHLRIENIHNIKAENFHQFKAMLYFNDGRVFDVTRQTQFSVDGYEQRQNGEFFFPLPTNMDIPYQVMVSATFYNGRHWSWAQQGVTVRVTPDSIEVLGKKIIQSGDVSQYQAIGVFGERRVDLTYKGRWHSSLGLIKEGFYRAPIHQSRTPVFDLINFSYAQGNRRLSIEVKR